MKIKRGFVTTLLVLLLIVPTLNLISATIIITQQPSPIYNLGDTINVPVTIKTTAGIAGTFQMNLVCPGQQMNFYKNGIVLGPGEEKKIESSLILSRSIIGNLKGTCSIETFLGQERVNTNDFKISDLITINSNLSKTNFNPEEKLVIKGNAVKENGKSVNGFVEILVLDGNSTIITQPGTINNGAFSVEIVFPKNVKAGNQLIRIKAYERDLLEEETNLGLLDKNIYINQIPTSLNIIFENESIEPGKSVKVKAVLYDQTGVKIDSTTFLTIKNGGKILEQVETSTDEFIEYPIAYNEPPATWKVVAVSNKLSSESTFNIIEKEDARVEIIDKTVLITNLGNIPYNKTVLVKISNQSFSIDVYLKVDQSQRWLLTAPNGEYAVQVVTDGKITGASVALTGEGINIRKASDGAMSLVKFPLVWIFILVILGFVAFIFFRRGYQKSFIGYNTPHSVSSVKNSPRTISSIKPQGNMYVYNPKSARAELDPSIDGDKQEASIITLKIRNLATLNQSEDKSFSELLNKIKSLAEDKRAATYENQENISFILCELRTKTTKNELDALKIAQKIKDMLTEKNRVLKQKIDFGISLTDRKSVV